MAIHSERINPTGDEPGVQFVTDADLDRFESIATPIYQSTFEAGKASKYLVSTLGQWIIRLVAEVRRLHRAELPEPSTEGYAEFESWEQEMFRHQPVLSMADGSIAGCQCLDRVFVKGREDWGTHLASVITSRLAQEPQGEPSDAQVEAVKDGVSRLAGMQLMRRYSSFGDPWWDALYNGIARVSLRVTGGAR